jgi:hypothetical protein
VSGRLVCPERGLRTRDRWGHIGATSGPRTTGSQRTTTVNTGTPSAHLSGQTQAGVAGHNDPPQVPDTEGVTGSNPVAPTNKTLTSGKCCRAHDHGAIQPKRWSVRCLRGRSRDGVSDGERFPCLTYLFMDPLGPQPAPPLLQAPSVCREPLDSAAGVSSEPSVAWDGHAPGGRPQLTRKSEFGVFDTPGLARCRPAGPGKCGPPPPGPPRRLRAGEREDDPPPVGRPRWALNCLTEGVLLAQTQAWRSGLVS